MRIFFLILYSSANIVRVMKPRKIKAVKAYNIALWKKIAEWNGMKEWKNGKF